jgi:TolA-binding protein
LGDEGVGRKKAKGRGDVETWHGLEDVVFAISSRKMAVEFAKAFGGHIQVEAGPGQDVDGEDEDEDGEDKVVQELRSKIQEMEGQIAQVWNADLKARMNVILQGLREQLSERGAAAEGSDDHEDQDEEEEEDLDEGGDDDGSRIDDFAGDEEIDDNGTDREGIGSDEGTDGFEVVDYDEALETSSTEGGLGLRR